MDSSYNNELLTTEKLESDTLLSLINLYKKVEELKKRHNNSNKYQKLCLDTIISDILSMQSFIKSLQFYRDAMENNKIGE